ncbi:hypothetical protein GQ457_17G012940 [Hibiscus cannabinus]
MTTHEDTKDNLAPLANPVVPVTHGRAGFPAVPIPFLPSFKSPSSPITVTDQEVAKRGKASSPVPDMDGSRSIDVDDQALDSNAGLQPAARVDLMDHGLGSPKVSYVQVVAGTNTQMVVEPSPCLDDVIVNSDDVKVDKSGPFPSVEFSEQPQWALQLVDLVNGYFLVMFENGYDYDHVLEGGPWTVFGSYLIVQPWSRDFSTSASFPNHMVWVRIQMVKTDYNTHMGDMGRFARLAVMVPLFKPLISRVKIDGTIYRLEYEGLQRICFSYGKYGHSMELCHAGQGSKVPHSDSFRAPVYKPWMIAPSMHHQPCKDSNRSKVSSTNSSSSGGFHFPILEDSVEKELASSDDRVELFSVERSWVFSLYVGSDLCDSSESPVNQGVASNTRGLAANVIISIGNQITRVESHVVQSVASNHSTISILDVVNERCRQSLINVGGRQVVFRRGVGDSLKANLKSRKGKENKPPFAASGEVDHAIPPIMVPSEVGAIRTSEPNAPRGLSGGIWLLWNGHLHGSFSLLCTIVLTFPFVVDCETVWRLSIRIWTCRGFWVGTLTLFYGGAIRGNGVSELFHDFIFDNGLLEVTFQGEVFTWKRGLWKCLDRRLFNDSLANCFLDSISSHLDRVGSGYCSLFSIILGMLAHSWNESVFRHIGKKKRELLARLPSIDRALQVRHSDFLVQLDFDLRAELAVVLNIKRVSGFKNLRFSGGEWCSDQTVLSDWVVLFYQELFTSSIDIDVSLAIMGCFRPYTAAMLGFRLYERSVLDCMISVLWLVRLCSNNHPLFGVLMIRRSIGAPQSG